MSESNVQLEAVTIVPGTLLGALIGLRRDGAHRNSYLRDALFNNNDGLLNGTLARLYADRIGGLVLYALGVRTYGEIQRVARARRMRDS